MQTDSPLNAIAAPAPTPRTGTSIPSQDEGFDTAWQNSAPTSAASPEEAAATPEQDVADAEDSDIQRTDVTIPEDAEVIETAQVDAEQPAPSSPDATVIPEEDTPEVIETQDVPEATAQPTSKTPQASGAQAAIQAQLVQAPAQMPTPLASGAVSSTAGSERPRQTVRPMTSDTIPMSSPGMETPAPDAKNLVMQALASQQAVVTGPDAKAQRGESIDRERSLPIEAAPPRETKSGNSAYSTPPPSQLSAPPAFTLGAAAQKLDQAPLVTTQNTALLSDGGAPVGTFGVSTPTDPARLSTTSSPRTVLTQAQHVSGQIVAQLTPLREGKLELNLSPEELGKVKMTISNVDGNIAILIAPDRPETADLLRRHIDLLREDMARAGLTDVDLSLASEQGAKSETGSDGTPSQHSGTTDDAAPLDAPVLRQPYLLSTNLDLRV